MELFPYIFTKVHRTTDWSDLGILDWSLISFNTLEAMIWFMCAAYVTKRNAASHQSAIERWYAALFILFGVSDLVELFQLSSPLIWAKLIILIALFAVRQRVLNSYQPKPKLL